MPHIISRADAINKGLKRYFTGNPCKQGHICERLVTGHCLECHKEHVKNYQSTHRNKIYEKSLEWRSKNPDKVKATAKRFRKSNAQAIKQWRKRNKALIRKLGQRYRKVNRKKLTAYEATRRASKLKATPSWSEKELIENFYNDVPKGMEVDHIIPLKNFLICGLHVLSNLQYLPRYENISKNNRFVSYKQTPDGSIELLPIDN